MNKFRVTLNILAVVFCILAVNSLAHAQTRTWVSGVGNDANPCSRTAPCKTFAGAISKTSLNGEINCLDPGGFGTVTITKSITIDCHEVFASVLNSGTNGINIAFDNFTAVGETRKTVRLRNLNFNGADTGLVGINITGAAGSNNSEVFVEDCLLDGNFSGTARGIFDQRTGSNTLLSINNTTVRDMNSTGISIVGSSTARVSISRSLVANCAFGVAAAQGRITIYDTVLVSNSTSGLDAESGATMDVDHCVVAKNTTSGFQANGAGSAIRVSNTTAVNNGTMATASAGGIVSSYGNNQTAGAAFPSPNTPPL